MVVCCLEREKFGRIFISYLIINCAWHIISLTQPERNSDKWFTVYSRDLFYLTEEGSIKLDGATLVNYKGILCFRLLHVKCWWLRSVLLYLAGAIWTIVNHQFNTSPSEYVMWPKSKTPTMISDQPGVGWVWLKCSYWILQQWLLSLVRRVQAFCHLWQSLS